MRARRTSSARIGGCRGGITRASTRATAPPQESLRADLRGVRDRWSIRGGARPTTRRRGAGAGSRARTFRSSPASIFPSRRTGAQAATFSELFAEVLHPVPARGRRAAGAGRGSARDADGAVRRVDLHGVERQVVVTRQVPCARVPRRRRGCDTPEGRCAPCHGAGKVRWARGHMVFTKSCARAPGTRPAAVCSAARACDGHGRAGADRGGARCGAGRACGDGARLRDRRARATPDARRRATAISTSTVQVAAAPGVPPRRRRPLLHRCRSAVHEAVLGARVEVPSLEGPVRLRISAGHAGRPAVPAARARRAGAAGGRGDLLVEVRIVLPQIVDERSQGTDREFGGATADVREAVVSHTS